MKRRTFFSIAAGGAVVIGLAGCAGDEGGSGSPGGAKELTIGILAEPSSWDPAQTHVGHLLQPYQFAYDSLILRKPDGSEPSHGFKVGLGTVSVAAL